MHISSQGSLGTFLHIFSSLNKNTVKSDLTQDKGQLRLGQVRPDPRVQNPINSYNFSRADVSDVQHH